MNQDLIPLALEDFSRGTTDYPLLAAVNQFSALNNVLIDVNKKTYTSPGCDIFDPSMYIIPTGNFRLSSLFSSVLPQLFLNSARHVWIPNSTAFLELLGPTSNPAFSAGTVNNQAFFADWDRQVFATNNAYAAPIKMYQDSSGTWQLRTAGLPQLASNPTITSSGGTGQYFSYAFSYHYAYTVGTSSLENFGPNVYVPAQTYGTGSTGIGAPNTNPITIAAIPTLSNGATNNYDTTNTRTYIYRTLNGGNVYYLVGSVTNGTTSFTDNFSDATIQNNLPLYTNSGVTENNPPPACKYITSVNGFTYYGNIQKFPNRVMQSDQDAADSVPLPNTIDFLDVVMGLSNYNDNPLVFTQKHVFRVNGVYAETGSGQVTYEDITKTVGCVSAASIVQTRYGVFWAGNDGFYWTDGFNFQKVSDSINLTYLGLVSTTTMSGRISGAYNSVDNKVEWAVQSNASSPDNDSLFVLDLRWGVQNASTFTTRSNGSNFSPTAITYYQNQILTGDRRGYLLTHSSTYNYDAYIDTKNPPSKWDRKALITTVTTCVSNLGVPNKRKWTPKVLLSMVNTGSVSAQIISINDNSAVQTLLKEIRYRGNFLWGDPSPVWGNINLLWNSLPLVEQMRRFLAGSLRCSYKQLTITSAFDNVYRSDDLAQGIVDPVAKSVKLSGGFSWPSYLYDYSISFDKDGYVENYAITTKGVSSGPVIHFIDPLNTAPTGAQSWVIRGYPKFESFSISSIVLYFYVISSQSYKTYRTEQDSDGSNSQ